MPRIGLQLIAARRAYELRQHGIGPAREATFLSLAHHKPLRHSVSVRRPFHHAQTMAPQLLDVLTPRIKDRHVLARPRQLRTDIAAHRAYPDDLRSMHSSWP
jgi:hypothetical protein